MKFHFYFVLLSAVFAAGMTVAAHGGEDHSKPRVTAVSDNEQSNQSACRRSAASDSFPHWHPLIVHFPIVLLLLAPVFCLAALFRPGTDLLWIAALVAGAGFLGALLATEFVHPHTTGLGPAAAFALERHELFADLTVWISGLATLATAAAIFFKHPGIKIIGLVLALAAAGSVGVAGHYGAKLVHIHGIGPCGVGLVSH